MPRATFLLPTLFCMLVMPGPVLAQRDKEEVLFKSGNIQVKRQVEFSSNGDLLTCHAILRDGINFGLCFEDPKYRRLPVTYYHPQGPVGQVFQKFNWAPGAVNTYHADARLAASLVALGFPSPVNCPLPQLAAMWSEPPVAVIGMAAGSPASYARPYQHFHFYEPNKTVIELNERKDKEQFFHFIADARQRGAEVRVFQGSPRQQLAQQGPRSFYHLMILEACSGEDGEKIFLELFTKEGIAQCFEHLVDDGILCVHTSHRFIDLPPVLAAIGKDLKLHVRRGHDQAPGNFKRELAEISHFSSEWVMLARHERTLDSDCKTPANYDELLKQSFVGRGERYWTTPVPVGQAWTDKGPNLLHGILRGHPFAMRYAAAVGPVADYARDVLEKVGVDWGMKRYLTDLSRLPRAVEDWMVQQQLKNNPEVEKLWQ